MIKHVKLSYFKMFRDETFDVSGNIVLAGPNNSGKSTLLQAIAVWNLAMNKWMTARGQDSGSKAKKRTGVAITRNEFTAIPLREMNLLWTNRSTGLLKNELQKGQKLGMKRFLHIGMEGTGPNNSWDVTFEFTYNSRELIYAKPLSDISVGSPIHEAISNLSVVHVPPFSGIGAEETGYDKAYQNFLIGQGKPGDILRNLLLDVYKNKENWDELCKEIEEIFGIELLPPMYEGQPFIVCEYRLKAASKRNLAKLDISSAGSGLLQVLMLLGFFYARPASILLYDEPDAHLHVILQKQVYNLLRNVAERKKCQLIIATHSEIFVDSTSPERILSFFKHPHRLVVETERDRVREALKRLTSLDILLAEQAPGIIYLESDSDLNLLREWAIILRHPVKEFLSRNPFWYNMKGRDPREARAHFFALQAVKENVKAVVILDGDNRNLPDHEIFATGLEILRWKRYEAENYLIHPESLSRFVRGIEPDLFSTNSAEKGLKYLREHLPPVVYENPIDDNDYLNVTPASKTLLPGFFEAAGKSTTKNEYYQIAAQMIPHEIPSEVIEKLDMINRAIFQT